MKLPQNKKAAIFAALALILAAAILLSIALFPTEEPSAPAPPADTRTTGFAFFNVGANTVFSDRIREALDERLGTGVLETRGTIDLRAGDPDFFKTHYPDLQKFHVQLNDQAGARVEHDITRLTYRYAFKKNTPFYYVELVFSNDAGHPLYFRIKAKKEGADIIDEIRKKYGEPKAIPRSGAGQPALSWRKGDDVFVIFQNRDRFGEPEFLIMVYFKKNIQTLIDIEEKQQAKAAEARKNSIRKAF